MNKYKLEFTEEDQEIIKRAGEIRTLVNYALNNIEAYEGEEFLNYVRILYNTNLEVILKKYSYVTLNEFCLKNHLKSFYEEGILKYESASNVLYHTSNADVPIIKTLNKYNSWVTNYPSEWLCGLIPAILGQPSIEYCR